MARASNSATPLLRSLVHRPQGVILVFYRNLEYGLVKIWLHIGILRQNKNRFGIWFLWSPFHWYRFGFGLSFS